MIIWVAFKKAWRKKKRFFLTILGVSLVIMLFIVLNILASGLLRSLFSHIIHTPADIWITSPGGGGLGSFFLAEEKLEEVAKISGVKKVEPVIEVSGLLSYKGNTVPVVPASYTVAGQNVPKSIAEGSIPKWKIAPGAVVDESLLFSFPGLEVGEVVKIGKYPVEVIGITRGHMLYYPVVFLTFDTLKMALQKEQKSTHFLIKVSSEKDASQISSEIERQVDGVSAMSKEEVIQAYMEELSFLKSLLYFLQFAALFIGILIIGVTTYTSVIEQTREFGILKAIGATNIYILKLVVVEAVLIGLLGLILAIVASLIFSLIFPKIVPMELYLEPLILIASFVSALVISGFGSLGAIWKTTKVDPIVATQTL